jgi:hypothetical protein
MTAFWKTESSLSTQSSRTTPQALADVGHAGVALANRALQLAVEALIVEIQLHAFAFFVEVVDDTDNAPRNQLTESGASAPRVG